MKLQLTGLRQLSLDEQKSTTSPLNEGWTDAEVLCCAICRTDAKIWTEGHRDLVLPRVPGHEMVVRKDEQNYAVWPGVACGICNYCKSGDENLCEEMQIIGFHLDGGFANRIMIPESCLIPLPAELSLTHACFAEPAGCVMNAFKKLNLQAGETILIIGGGIVGLLAAVMAKALGAIPTVLEKQESKIRKAEALSNLSQITVLKETTASGFDCVMNACADPLALLSGITRLAKAGRIVHFSGLTKNEQLETNLLNLVHYKELRFSGSYGLTKADMEAGINSLQRISQELELLIEDKVLPAQVERCMQRVINGEVYKYIIDFRQTGSLPTESVGHIPTDIEHSKAIRATQSFSFLPLELPVIDRALEALAQEKMDDKAKPLGALGTMEKLALRMSLVQNSLNPVVKRKVLFVFAADHGIAEEGVSAYPQEVTGQMVMNFLHQGAAINVLCAHHHIDLSIVDAGVNSSLPKHPHLISKPVARGTRNFALQPAMTKAEAIAALQVGREVFNQSYQKEKVDVVGLGEMGIANTSSATALISVLTGQSVAACTGRGTGVDDQALDHKIEVLEKALAFHQPDAADALEVLMKVGGFEIAAMAGAALEAASKRCVVVLDGLISTAAGLVAYTFNPDIKEFLVAGHKSVEQGHLFALNKMGLEPVLDLQMRLGEGTGAALTINLLEASCKIMCDMASFDEAGISGKKIRRG